MCKSLAFAILVLCSAPLRAQTPSAPRDTAGAELVRVFMDCQSNGCDDQFFRTEIAWVDFVRDRTAASVFVLITSQRTGSGGEQYTLNFDGQGALAGVRDSLAFATRQGNTEDENRRALARALSFGLLRFARSTPIGERLQLSLRPSTSASPMAAARGANDKWNLWVYSISANTFANGDANYKSGELFGNLSARRVTEAWRFSFSGFGSYSESSFKLSSGTETNSQRSYGVSGLGVKSAGKQLSFGWNSSLNSSKFENYRLALQVMPAIEYNLFPYVESTRRQLVVRYGIGMRSFQYDSTTIYGKLKETKPAHELVLAAEARQKWGSLNFGITGNQFLDDFDKRRLSINGGASWRIVRGLEFNLFGSYSVLRDQLNIRRGNLDDADILLRQRQLQSGYNYFGSVGLSYTFGSVFNNVVNPRFASGGRSFIRF